MIICFRIFVGLQHEFMVFDMFISNLFFFSNNLRSFYIIVAQFRLQQCNALFFGGNLTFTHLVMKMHHINRENDPPLCVYI